MSLGVDRIRRANYEPGTCGYGNLTDTRCIQIGGGGNAGTEKYSDHFAFGKRLDITTRVEHDNAVAAANEIAFEQGAISELKRIRKYESCYKRRHCASQNRKNLIHYLSLLIC